MRFGLVHRVMTDLLATLGILCLVTSGELGRFTPAATLILLVAALAVPEPWQVHPATNRIATLAPVAVLLVQVGRLAWGAPVLRTVVEFAILLQIARLATRRGAAQDQQVIVLAWLHLIAGTVLGGGLSYALCLAGFLMVAPAALVLSHLRREVEGNYRQGARDRTGMPVDVPRILRSRRVVGRTFLVVTCLLAVPIFLFTATIFVLFPRVGLSLMLLGQPSAGRMIGFSDHVTLGGVGTLRNDPTIVLRVEVSGQQDPPPQRLSMYLRGTALDAYDRHAWSRSSSARVPAERQGSLFPIERKPVPDVDAIMRLELEPIDPTVIFLPPHAVAMRVQPRGEPLLRGSIGVLKGAEGDYQYAGPDQRGIAYEVYLGAATEVFEHPLAARERGRYLALPRLTPRVENLALEWTAGAATPREKARAVEHRLRTTYAYDLSSPSGAAQDPLDHFLFESHRGHCEYFSTAMAVLLRRVGVPTRNVTGFIGGSYNRFGRYYSVRQGDAHSWVEAYVSGVGWERFDPTPSVGAQPMAEAAGMWTTLRDILEAMGRTWDHRVVRYDLRQQLWLVGGARHGLARAGSSAWSLHLRLTPAQKRRFGAALLLALAIGSGAYLVWRRAKSSTRDPGPMLEPTVRRVRDAARLYEILDQALAAIGVRRAPGIPPLRHALALVETGHPVASDVLQLTERYLRARFGNEPLGDEERRVFEQRVAHIKASPIKGRRAKKS